INCGCWVKNVALRGEGAGLLRDIPHFEKIVRSTVNATRLPVTVKTRLGWDDQSIVIVDVAKMVEQTGAKALTIHCRTRTQGYKGDADWMWLEKVKKAVSIPIIGNGDIESPQDVKRMLETGCDGVMIGRGAIMNPWIFQQAKHFLKTGDLLASPSAQERIEVCLEHLKLAYQYKDVKGGIIPFRKYYAGYLHGLPNAAKVRSELMALIDHQEIVNLLSEYAQSLENQTLMV
ncbi:MAG: tRNA-dihydrouridine synthase, partial [Candidatus Omnitrophica bacterium]|nr:tRNA-dihydrouridine synthase [Candidatus Omnitrophota bacterium]